MAGSRIKGITIEIGGDTSGLQKALSDVNGKIKSTESQLKDVNNLLKLDPSNTVLVAQKQALLSEAVADTAEKLDSLEAAQKDVTAALEAGEIGQEQYMAFQREVEETRVTLARYQTELDGLSADQERLATNTERLNKLFDATGTSVDDYADILGSRLVTAIKNGSASSDQLKQAIEKIGRSATGGKADINQLTAALDTVDDGQAIQNLIQELKEAGNQADNTSEQLENMGNTLAGGVMLEAADQLSAVGDKITELGGKAADAFTETQDATVKASTYFAETGDAAKQTADVIKDVYGQGVGDSMDSVSDAVITVKENIKDLDQATLTNLTEQALTLESMYGKDMSETLRGVNALMTQFGLDAQTAMDYVVTGTQNGLDKTNELGDNLSEYSGKFAQAGYSAQEYFQLLQNGLDGGAYNLDKVNDAINEVTTRLVDGTIADSIGSYSTKTQELFAAWQQGGATQKDVINSIVADIAGCTNQQEALNMAATAFGTMAEDGNAKFITSLTTMGSTYDSVTGSAQNMYSQSTTEAQKFEATQRQLQQALVPVGEALMSLANDILPPVAAAIQTVGDFFNNLPGPIKNFVIILGALIAAFTALAPAIAAVAIAVTALEVPLLPIIGIIAGVAAAIAGIIAIVQNWGAITEWFGNVWAAVKEKCSQIWTAICAFFTETIPAAWDSLVAKFQAIPEWWSGIWTQVKTFFENTWNAIMQNPVVQTIVTTIQTLFQNLVSTLQGIWSGLTQIASGAWELLKNTILAPVLLLIDLVTGNFTQLASDAQNIWNNIKNAAAQIWSGIKQVVSSIASGLANGVKIAITGLQNALSSIWSAVKNAASNAWNGIKSFVVNTANNLKQAAVNAFNNLVSGIRNTLSSLGNIVRNGFQSAISFITSLPSRALQWGADFINGIARGIRNAIGAVTSAVSNVASKIRSFLHFSVPDEGPLTEYESWMPDFMKGLAKGINQSKKIVTDAVSKLSAEMVITPDIPDTLQGVNQALGTVNVGNAGSNADIISAVNDLSNRMIDIMSQYFPQFANQQLVMDTGTLVGEIATKMDDRLGIMIGHKERGI